MPDLMLLGAPTQKNYSTIYETPASLGGFISATGDRTAMDNPVFGYAASNIISPKGSGVKFSMQEAQKLAADNGVNMKIPEDGINADKFYFNLYRQKEKQDYQQVIDRKPDGAVASSLGVGTSLLTQAQDPLNLATGLIPVVGPARYTAMLGKASTPLARFGIRAGIGAAEGAVGTAALEPVNYYLANSLGDDYTAYTSFMNIAFGMGLSGTISGGGGILADTFGIGSGMVRPMSKVDRAELMQAAAQRLMRDGSVDVGPLTNAYVRKNLLSTTAEAKAIPGIETKTNYDVAYGRAANEVSMASGIPSRIAALEAQLSKAEKMNQYDRALNEYDTLSATEAKTPNEQLLQARKIDALNKRYGDGFESEARHYLAYKDLADDLAVETKPKKIKDLKARLNEMDKRFGGRLSKAYDQREVVSDIERQAMQQELQGLQTRMSDDVNQRMSDMKSEAALDLIRMKDDFSRGVDTRASDKIVREVQVIDDELAKIKVDNIESQSAMIDEDIAGLREIDAEFDKRNSDIKFDDIDDADFDISDIVASAKNYAKCLMR